MVLQRRDDEALKLRAGGRARDGVSSCSAGRVASEGRRTDLNLAELPREERHDVHDVAGDLLRRALVPPAPGSAPHALGVVLFAVTAVEPAHVPAAAALERGEVVEQRLDG